MADHTGIEWTDATWNPVRGCSRVSEGCRFCYAEGIAARFSDPGAAYHGYAERGRPGSKWTGKVSLIPAMLDQPLRWKRPRRIFVNSMSDLFHENLPDEAIDQVFAAMALAPHHTFQVLTKRLARMQRYIGTIVAEPTRDTTRRLAIAMNAARLPSPNHDITFPLPNLWLGTSVENQPTANERIPALQATPAALRFLSCEPLLGPLDLRAIDVDGHSEMDALRPSTWREVWESDWSPRATGMALDDCIRDFVGDGGRYPPDDVRPAGIGWVIAGGESGPSVRPSNPQWFRDLRDQCTRTHVPFFFKQWGEWVSVSEVEGPGEPFTFPDERSVRRVGKRKAGNTLDGVRHQAFPA